ncbi:MAG: translocation/assembly module TamB domain-containing protein, partial [Fidelibacterota bacterium]
IKDAPVDLAFHATTSRLDFITPYFEDIDSLNGEFDVDLYLSGTFQQLIRNGKLTVKNGTVELFVMENPITGVNGEIIIENNLLRVVRLEGHTPQLGRGRKDPSYLSMAGTMDMTRFFKPAFDLQLSGEHVYFSRPLGEIEIVGNPSLAVTGRDTVFFVCEYVPDPGQAYFRMDLTGSESYVLKEPDEGTIMVYDIHVPFYSGAIVENSDVNNAEIEGEITLSRAGSEDWSYAGNIDVISGDFYYGRPWDIQEGSVTPDPANLNDTRIYIRATTQHEFLLPDNDEPEPVDITLVLTGTLSEPQYSFEYPPSILYTESDLFQLLALGKERETEYDPTVTAGLSLTKIVLRRFEENARQVSGLDRFQIQTASPRTIIPEPQEVRFHIGKRLSPRLYVGVQADPTLSFNQYQIAYRLSRMVTPLGFVDQSVVGSVDEKGLYQIKYRLKLRY